MTTYDELSDKEKAAIEWKIGVEHEKIKALSPMDPQSRGFYACGGLQGYQAQVRDAYPKNPKALGELIVEYEQHLASNLSIGSKDSGIGRSGSKTDKK